MALSRMANRLLELPPLNPAIFTRDRPCAFPHIGRNVKGIPCITVVSSAGERLDERVWETIQLLMGDNDSFFVYIHFRGLQCKHPGGCLVLILKPTAEELLQGSRRHIRFPMCHGCPSLFRGQPCPTLMATGEPCQPGRTIERKPNASLKNRALVFRHKGKHIPAYQDIVKNFNFIRSHLPDRCGNFGWENAHECLVREGDAVFCRCMSENLISPRELFTVMYNPPPPPPAVQGQEPAEQVEQEPGDGGEGEELNVYGVPPPAAATVVPFFTTPARQSVRSSSMTVQIETPDAAAAASAPRISPDQGPPRVFTRQGDMSNVPRAVGKRAQSPDHSPRARPRPPVGNLDSKLSTMTPLSDFGEWTPSVLDIETIEKLCQYIADN